MRVAVPVANALAGCAETLARRARDAGLDVRWVAPVNYHLTLKYLGWTREETVGAVRAAVAAAVAGTPRLGFKTSRLGAFKTLEKASILWAGVSDDGGALARLAAAVDRAACGLGFRAEPNGFHPHVTLGRIRDPKAVREVILPLAEQMFGDTRIDALTLFETEQNNKENSKLGTKIVYREVCRIGFDPAENASISAPERQREPVQLGASTNSLADLSSSDTDDGWPRGQGPTDS
ncbi:MAG: RNA 2',3'-cyclic phosphodiesterase [Deltaproteobacteria bacterium]|nr:RNA 2',3'-cyclic phosphodiesterase [Deltaproteobacteria bacterium]